jgi:hypothetical protein
MKRPNQTGQWAARMRGALALLFVGFAHQPVAVASCVLEQLALYKLPDSALPVICLSE